MPESPATFPRTMNHPPHSRGLHLRLAPHLVKTLVTYKSKCVWTEKGKHACAIRAGITAAAGTSIVLPSMYGYSLSWPTRDHYRDLSLLRLLKLLHFVTFYDVKFAAHVCIAERISLNLLNLFCVIIFWPIPALAHEVMGMCTWCAPCSSVCTHIHACRTQTRGPNVCCLLLVKSLESDHVLWFWSHRTFYWIWPRKTESESTGQILKNSTIWNLTMKTRNKWSNSFEFDQLWNLTTTDGHSLTGNRDRQTIIEPIFKAVVMTHTCTFHQSAVSLSAFDDCVTTRDCSRLVRLSAFDH